MDWQCNITKIRPITLLDTIRKAIIKMLINHLFTILAKYKVLKENNFTNLLKGLLKFFIKIINMIIKNAKFHKCPIWILLQNLSKMYNRVNLDIIR